MWELRHIHHQVFALGKKLMQWRIKGTDHHWKSVHRFEEAGEIRTLHGQQLLQTLLTILHIVGKNHCHNMWQTVFSEEHVFGSA